MRYLPCILVGILCGFFLDLKGVFVFWSGVAFGAGLIFWTLREELFD